MSIKSVNELTDVLSAPLGDLIAEIGYGVANAQYAMDQQSLALLEAVYQKDEAYLEQLRAMGYRPNWYQIPEAEAEIQLSLSVTGAHTNSHSGKPSAAGKLKMYAAPMNANYKNSFNYELSASSKLKIKIVPVPEPSYLDQQNIIPRLEGKTLTEAKAMLEQLDIPFTFDNDSDMQRNVFKTVPAAGEMLRVGDVLSVFVDI